MCLFFWRKKTVPPVNDITVVYLTVPYKKVQGKDWCLPASAQMIMAYYGRAVAQATIANRVVIGGNPNLFKLLSYARELGYEAEWKRIAIGEIEDNLRQGVPLIAIQKYSNTIPYEHSRVITGFDTIKQELTMHDSAGKSNYKISYDEYFKLGFDDSKMSQIIIIKCQH